MTSATSLPTIPLATGVNLASIPVAPPPNGTISNFINPPSRGPLYINITSPILALAILFFLNRAYVKLALLRKISWDDATLFIAVLGSLVYHGLTIYGLHQGATGRHLWDISIEQAIRPNRQRYISNYITAITPPISFCFLKMSFFLLYLTVFKQLRWAQICSWIGLVLTLLVYSGLAIAVFILATPKKIESWSTNTISPAQLKITKLGIPAAIVGLVMDLYILLIPLIGVSSLTLSWKRKIGVNLVFFSGILACVCSAYNLYYRVIQTLDTKDPGWAAVPVFILTFLEMFVGIICACTPAVAYAARHQDSIYQKCFRLMARLCGSRGASYKGDEINRGPALPEPQLGPNPLASTDKKYARYFNLRGFTITASNITGNEFSNESVSNKSAKRGPEDDLER